MYLKMDQTLVRYFSESQNLTVYCACWSLLTTLYSQSTTICGNYNYYKSLEMNQRNVKHRNNNLGGQGDEERKKEHTPKKGGGGTAALLVVFLLHVFWVCLSSFSVHLNPHPAHLDVLQNAQETSSSK